MPFPVESKALCAGAHCEARIPLPKGIKGWTNEKGVGILNDVVVVFVLIKGRESR